MSLHIRDPEPRRRTTPRKSAKASTPRRAAKPAAPRVRPDPAHLLDAERLFRRFEQLLPEGDYVFSQLRQDFSEWCSAGDIAPPSAITLAAWLKRAGLSSYRSGRAKVTTYAKRAARLAA